MKEQMDPMKKKELIERSKKMERLHHAGTVFDEFGSYYRNHELEPDVKYAHMVTDLIADCWKARKVQGMTQQEIAEKMGTKQTAISRFENGNCTPSLNFLLRYTDALGMKIDIKDMKVESEKMTSEFESRNVIDISSEDRIKEVTNKTSGQQIYSPRISDLTEDFRKIQLPA